MSRLTHSLAAKAIAIFLFIISGMTFILGIVGAYAMYGNEFYRESEESIAEDTMHDMMWNDAQNILYNVMLYAKSRDTNYDGLLKYYKFDEKSTNMFASIYDDEGNFIFDSGFSGDYKYSGEYKLVAGVYSNPSNNGQSFQTYYGTASGEDETYTVKCFVKSDMKIHDKYAFTDYLIPILYSMKYSIYLIITVAFVLLIASHIFLLCTAGKRNGREGIVPNFLDKIPLDLYICAAVFINAISIAFIPELNSSFFIVTCTVIAGVLLVISYLALTLTFATRIKLGKWWRNTIVYRILNFVCRILKFLFQCTISFTHYIPLIWKVIGVFCLLSLLELIVICTTFYDPAILLFLFFIEKIILTAVIALITINMRRIEKGAENMRAGDLSRKINTNHMFWNFKKHAENLNSLSDGLKIAVRDNMKSERLKTELITNVSHDIKTPLTSIINYVDLLKKENIDEEPAHGYVEILDRQSIRLKKLIEDLVEASKASTGNINVNLTRTALGVMLTQSLGEYAERFAAKNLTPIIGEIYEDIYIMADGQLLWRIYDNLLGNISKYAMEGTRIYFDMRRNDASVTVTFKNISATPLNISSDELMERFVRGDSSRSTEGSGLGLSIAKSLAELMNASMAIYIDGDLFKVILTFDIESNI